MKRFFLIFFSVFILIVLGVGVWASTVDWNQYKDQIVSRIKDSTGYQVTIEGNLGLNIFPYPSFQIEDISVATPNNKLDQDLLSLKRVKASLSFLPLFLGQVHLDQIVLIEPKITLAILSDGTFSWLSKKNTLKNSDNERQVKEKPASNSMQAVSINQLKIVDGVILYQDFKKDQKHHIKSIQASIKADRLTGPFQGDGSIIYQEHKVVFDTKIGAYDPQKPEISLQTKIELPDKETKIIFSGLAAIQAPYEVQGEAELLASNIGKLIGQDSGSDVSIKSLLTANEERISLGNIDAVIGAAKGSGKIEVSNIKTRNPLLVNVAFETDGAIDFGALNKKRNNQSENIFVSSNYAVETNKSIYLIPETITLPIAIDGQINLNAHSFKIANHEYKGVFVDLNKKESNIDLSFKVLDFPGKGNVKSQSSIRFKSSSRSEKDGAITYADPEINAEISGHIDQFPFFASEYFPDLSIENIGQRTNFNFKGRINPTKLVVSKGTLGIDQTSFNIGAEYQPAHSKRKPFLDVSVNTDLIDFDGLQKKFRKNISVARSDDSNAEQVSQSTESKKPAGFKNIHVPVDMDFEFSAVEAKYNTNDFDNLKFVGEIRNKSLGIDSLSLENFAGTNIRVKGQIDNISELSGINLNVYSKSQDIQKIYQSLGQEIPAFIKPLKQAEANINIKGKAKSFSFASNIKALQGQLDTSGNVVNTFNNPEITKLTVRAKHPNFKKITEAFIPNLTLASGLEKSFDFYTEASLSEKKYSLSNIKANLGPMSLTGRMTLGIENKKPSLSGDLRLGTVPLDDFMGGNKKNISQTTSTASSGQSRTTERWSSKPIDFKWIDTADLNLDITAKAINQGGWNFVKPTTKIIMKEGVFQIQDLKAGLFGGQASLNTKIQASQQNSSAAIITTSSIMNNVAVEPLVKALSQSNKLKGQGTVSLNIDTQTSGNSAKAFINGLTGKSTLQGSSIILEGFDLARMARGLSADDKIFNSFENLAAGSLRGGKTRFDIIEGSYLIDKGIVNIDSMALDGPDAIINITGNANLPAWTIDILNTITLKNVDDLKPFNVAIKGPLDNPANTFGRGIVEDYLKRKLQRKLDKELGGALEKFGILPPSNAQQPSQPPAAGDQLQNQQNQQPSAEDAIRGVLEGLLR